MAENCLTIEDLAKQLKVSRSTICRRLPKMMAHGLQRVQAGRQVRFRESSFKKLIKRCAERSEPLW